MSVDEEVNTGHTGSSLTPSPQLLECTAACNNISITTEVKLSTTDRMAGGSDAMAAGLVLPNRTGSTDARPGSGKPCEKPEGDENHVNHSKSSKQQQQLQQQPPQQHQHQQQKLSMRRNTASFGFNHPASGKQRRRANSESDSVLPSNFLLGGNIFDPLNLNSLLDEEVSRALNAETPNSPPLPAKHREPVEILIPCDITDPLILNRALMTTRLAGWCRRSRVAVGVGGTATDTMEEEGEGRWRYHSSTCRNRERPVTVNPPSPPTPRLSRAPPPTPPPANPPPSPRQGSPSAP
ncbi:hypothetical protein CRUP_022283 [Coryphaenoides rupestris]|nr:hypothetical protein CRUP_022283 [Coryphaenoides rupestris]